MNLKHHVRTHTSGARVDIINHLIKRHQYHSYLEIGTHQQSKCFDLVQARVKHSVDTGEETTEDTPMFLMSSDQFFEQNQLSYDLIFIDGLHVYEQTYQDIINSWSCLNDGGTIVCHDMSPQIREHQLRTRVDPKGLWNGDCWRAWVRLRCERPDWNMCVIDADFGVGVIQAGAQQTLDLMPSEWTWEGLKHNRELWLNLINMDQWMMLHA